MEVLKFLKLQEKTADERAENCNEFSAPCVSSTTKHEIDSKLRKPTNYVIDLEF